MSEMPNQPPSSSLYPHAFNHRLLLLQVRPLQIQLGSLIRLSSRTGLFGIQSLPLDFHGLNQLGLGSDLVVKLGSSKLGNHLVQASSLVGEVVVVELDFGFEGLVPVDDRLSVCDGGLELGDGRLSGFAFSFEGFDFGAEASDFVRIFTVFGVDGIL